MNKVIIIGGGPAGIMAAIAASRAGAKVVIIDKNNEYGKKLSITGNGKCNYSNRSITDRLDWSNYNFDKDSICGNIIRKYDALWLQDFFENEGMLSIYKDDLIYPHSEQAASVLYTLKESLIKQGIELTVGEVKQIAKTDKGYSVLTDNNMAICGDKLILATGGKAAPKTGSSGGGYKLARTLGHTVSFTYPGLCKLCFDSKKYSFLSNAQGVRAKVRVKAYVDDAELAVQDGELQLTKDALSGICIFNLSRFLSKAIEEGKVCSVSIDFVPSLSEAELIQFFDNGKASCKDTKSILMGIINEKLADSLIKEYKDRELIIKALKNLRVSISGHGSYDEAQVTIGGVDLAEIDANLESNISPGLFFAGEILDVDAACGGYNLHWAFVSGYLAGNSASK